MTDALVLNGVAIDDGFAEAFPMKATRVLVTAHNAEWARHAALAATGFATSVIACGCEAGIERELPPEETPDGRPGVSLLFFCMSGRMRPASIRLMIAFTCAAPARPSGNARHRCSAWRDSESRSCERNSASLFTSR